MKDDVMIRPTNRLAAFLAFATFGLSWPAHAVTLTPGDTARIDFAATTASPPFDFVTLTLNFSNGNPFGTNETLRFSTFDANNMPLITTTFASGNSIYTSGLGGALTQNAINVFNPSTLLTTSSFYAIVSPVVGSFDLISAQANFEHIIFTSGPNQLGVQGTFAAPVPGPIVGAGLPGLIAACGAMVGLARRRRRATA